jgi:predicted nuclease of predicted toxin-antitoxin system
MKLLFDENLPPGLVGTLGQIFPDSVHVHACGLGEADDGLVWEHARQHGFTIVTKDSDYEQLSVLRGSPPRVIWLRTGNCTTAYLTALLARHRDLIEAFGASESDAILELR